MPVPSSNMRARRCVSGSRFFLTICSASMHPNRGADAHSYVPFTDFSISVFQNRRPSRVKRLFGIGSNICILGAQIKNELQCLFIKICGLLAGFCVLEQHSSIFVFIFRKIAICFLTNNPDAVLNCRRTPHGMRGLKFDHRAGLLFPNRRAPRRTPPTADAPDCKCSPGRSYKRKACSAERTRSEARGHRRATGEEVP